VRTNRAPVAWSPVTPVIAAERGGRGGSGRRPHRDGSSPPSCPAGMATARRAAAAAARWQQPAAVAAPAMVALPFPAADEARAAAGSPARGRRSCPAPAQGARFPARVPVPAAALRSGLAARPVLRLVGRMPRGASAAMRRDGRSLASSPRHFRRSVPSETETGNSSRKTSLFDRDADAHRLSVRLKSQNRFRCCIICAGFRRADGWAI